MKYNEPYMHNEPTIADSYYPYNGGSEIPPPPPKKNRYTFLWGLFSGLFLAVLVSLSLAGYMLYGHASTKNTATSTHVTAKVQPTAKPTPNPTIIIETPTPQPPTPTPTRTVSYYASDIYNDFYANGLGGSNPKNDTHWSCGK